MSVEWGFICKTCICVPTATRFLLNPLKWLFSSTADWLHSTLTPLESYLMQNCCIILTLCVCVFLCCYIRPCISCPLFSVSWLNPAEQKREIKSNQCKYVSAVSALFGSHTHTHTLSSVTPACSGLLSTWVCQKWIISELNLSPLLSSL